MAVDWFLAEELIDAAIDELEEHLPTTWWQATAASTEAYLRLCEHGDLADYCGNDKALLDQLPAIFIRPLDVTPVPADGGVGGIDAHAYALRLVHVRHFDQCYTDAGARQTNMTRARSRYASIITASLFAHATGRLDSPTLTVTSGTAQVTTCEFERWDLGTDMAGGTPDVQVVRLMQQKGARIWAIACDFTVQTCVVPS